MTALQHIIKEAKIIKKKYPNKEWKDCVSQASAIYSSKHSGKSPVGKKKKKVVKKITVGKYASIEAIERMDQLTRSTDLIEFSHAVNNIIDDLLEEGFELSEIKEYVKVRLDHIFIIYK